jgi:hyperosmotically inducible periplasmic protein
MSSRHFILLTRIGLAGFVLAAGAAFADDPPQHSDSLGAAVSDTATTAKVKERLADDSRLGDARISVTTNNGNVTLTGTAPSADASDAAEQLAEGVRGVKSVDNQIAAPSKVREAGIKVTDDWITTRIKTELFTQRTIQGDSNISVSTSHGVVRLTGTAVSKEAYDQAKSVAENVKGVVKVDASALRMASN